VYPCGHPMVATDGNGLYRVARGHTRGDQRPEKRYTNEFWRECIKKSARELGPGHFEGARFDGADLVRANLHRAHAEYAPSKVRGSTTQYYFRPTCGRRRLRRGDLTTANLEEYFFDETAIVDSTFEGAELRPATFDEALLVRCNFECVACSPVMVGV